MLPIPERIFQKWICQLVLWTLRGGFCFAQLLGIVSFTSSGPSQRVCKSFWRRIYAGLLLISTVAAFPLIMSTIYAHKAILQETDLLGFVGYKSHILLLLCAVLTLLMQICRQSETVACGNRMLSVMQQLHNMTPADKIPLGLHMSLSILCKAMASTASIVWAMFLLVHDKAPQRFCYFMATVFFLYCHLLLQMTLNMFYVGMWLIVYHSRQLNALLRAVLQDGQLLSGRARRLKRLQQRWVAHELEHIMRCYAALMRLSRTWMHLHEIQLLSFLAFSLIECVVQLFLMYYVAFSSYIPADRRPPPINVSAIAYVMGTLWDMCLLIWMGQEMKSHFQATRGILAEGSLLLRQRDIDARLHASLEQFTLYLRSTNRRMSCAACGLFHLDNGLLFTIFKSILMYLSVLMQFDMILYNISH